MFNDSIKIGTLLTLISGFGITFVYSIILDPLPPAKITTGSLEFCEFAVIFFF